MRKLLISFSAFACAIFVYSYTNPTQTNGNLYAESSLNFEKISIINTYDYDYPNNFFNDSLIFSPMELNFIQKNN